MRKLMFFAFIFVIFSCGSSGEINSNIIDRPINFNEEREELSIQYINEHYGLEKDIPNIQPKVIVLHWTAIPDLESSFKAFDPVTLPNAREEIQGAGNLNVSAHFLVDRDGKIYRLMPETMMARHVIGLNHTAIGVENVGGTEDTPLTQAQLNANIWLVDYLANKYDIEYLIGHHEYTLFENHPLWLEKDDGYRTQKTDPGEDFMAAVRNASGDLNFKLLPEK